MKKRQSKKQELASQVDILFNATSSTLVLANMTGDRLDKVVEMENKNFEVIGKDIGSIVGTLDSVTDIQKDVVPEVIENRLAILSMQKQLKVIRWIITALSITIFVLGWKG